MEASQTTANVCQWADDEPCTLPATVVHAERGPGYVTVRTFCPEHASDAAVEALTWPDDVTFTQRPVNLSVAGRCPACAELVESCPGHDRDEDPRGHERLQFHDGGDHSLCLPEGCGAAHAGDVHYFGEDGHCEYCEETEQESGGRVR